MHRIAVRSLKILTNLKCEKWTVPCANPSHLVSVLFRSNDVRYFSDEKDSASKHFEDEERTEDDKSYELITAKYFKVDENEQNKKSFEGAIDIFTHKDGRRRGDVEFIYGALRNMEKFGVHRDLASYKKLFNVFPKGKYVPENRLQADFFHYPRQQDCALKVMVYMEKHNIIPDEEFGDMILNTFGKISQPFKKYCRMMYWLPKLKNISPWLLPDELPDDALELAKMGIRQITSVDRLTDILVYNAEELEQATDKTWIVSGQSPDQKELLKELESGTPVYVEGAFRVWLRDVQVNYFILRGAPKPRIPDPQAEMRDVQYIRLWMDGQKETKEELKLDRYPTIHEQEDGTIFAVCATGTSSRESLLSWIRFLEKENPKLSDLAVLFTLQSPLGPVIPINESSDMRQS
jgi:signaling intermediate in Toll pathway protein